MNRFEDIIDRRPGYQRQEEEPIVHICECGAKVLQHKNELVHMGPCSIETQDPKPVENL